MARAVLDEPIALRDRSFSYGEEFLVLLPATPPQAAAALAEELRRAVASISIDSNDQEVRFTASMGVTGYRDGDKGFDSLLSRGDLALYRAKNEGRDRVVVA